MIVTPLDVMTHPSLSKTVAGWQESDVEIRSGAKVLIVDSNTLHPLWVLVHQEITEDDFIASEFSKTGMPMRSPTIRVHRKHILDVVSKPSELCKPAPYVNEPQNPNKEQ